MRTRAKYLPLERAPPAPHPDNGVLLTVQTTGSPALKNRQSYVTLKPFVIESKHLQPLYGGSLKLTPAAFQRVRLEVAQRYPKPSQLPPQLPMQMRPSATPLLQSVGSRSSSVGSARSIWTEPNTPSALYSMSSPPLRSISETGRYSPKIPTLPKLPRHESHTRRQSPAAVARQQSLGRHRTYPTYPTYPSSPRTPLLYGSNGQVSVREDIFAPAEWPAAAQPEERDFCGRVFVFLQIVIVGVVLLSLCVLALWLFLSLISYLHM